MATRKDEGMTILEVVIAITILLIGAGFIFASNSLSYHYLAQQELRQQMVFFAAGGMEAALEKTSSVLEGQNQSLPANNKFTVNYFDAKYDQKDDSALPAFPSDLPSLPQILDSKPIPIIPFGVSISDSSHVLPNNVVIYNYLLELP